MRILLSHKRFQPVISVTVIALMFFVSCKDEIKDPVTFVYDTEVVPMMRTDSVTMLISDSGLIRYKMVTKVWDVFERAKDPHWLFPKGIYLEQYDSTFKVVATIKADSAWNYTRRRQWVLRGNVKMNNVKKEMFSSDELIWDEASQKVYSNKYVVIHQPNKMTLRAHGFESNQQMTEYKFRRAENTDIYVNEEKQAEEEKKE